MEKLYKSMLYCIESIITRQLYQNSNYTWSWSVEMPGQCTWFRKENLMDVIVILNIY